MKFGFLFFVLTGALYAETVGPVTYHMPTSDVKWLANETHDEEQGTTVIYYPENIEKVKQKEFFAVNSNKYATDVNDLKPLQAGLSQMMPSAEIKVWSLEKSKNDILYEWTATVEGKEKLHGWGRGFNHKDGTVLIGYQADGNIDVEYARKTWLPVLKQAKLN